MQQSGRREQVVTHVLGTLRYRCVRVLRIAKRQQARCWELRAACDLASLWRRDDRATEALQLLQPIYDQFTKGFDAADLRQARQILDSLRSDDPQKASTLKTGLS
jgi:predicted ATPase